MVTLADVLPDESDKKPNIKGVTLDSGVPVKNKKDEEVGTIRSILSGVASGIFKIPEGVVSLGANLIDLGAGTNTAANVEKFFDTIKSI